MTTAICDISLGMFYYKPFQAKVKTYSHLTISPCPAGWIKARPLGRGSLLC